MAARKPKVKTAFACVQCEKPTQDDAPFCCERCYMLFATQQVGAWG